MKRFLYTIGLLILLTGTNCFATETAEEIFAKGYAQLYKGNNNAAISAFEKGIKQYPDAAFLYAGIGDTYKKEKKYKQAMEYYSQAMDQPTAIDNYLIDFYDTNTEQNLKDIDEALNALMHATKNFDTPILFENINLIMNEKFSLTKIIPEMYLNTADIEVNNANKLKESGESEAAIKAYLKILATSPQNFQAANNAGATLIEQRDYVLAQKYLEQALKSNPNSAIIYNNLGILKLYQRQYKEMNEYFEKSLKENNKYLLAINNKEIAKIQSSIGYYQTENVESIINVVKKDIENIYAIRTLAKIYFLKGDYDSAHSILEPLDSTYNFKLYTQKALTALKTSDFYNAINYINKAIDLYPENSIDYEIRGRIFATIGKHKEAKNDFQIAIEKDVTNQNVYYHLARTLNKLGESQNALTYMKMFISMKNGNPDSQYIYILFE